MRKRAINDFKWLYNLPENKPLCYFRDIQAIPKIAALQLRRGLPER